MKADELAAGAQILLSLLLKERPRIVCFVGMGIWKELMKYMVASKAVPPKSQSASFSGDKKNGGGRLLPENALMPYKLVHTFHVKDDSIEPDKAVLPVKREPSPLPEHSTPPEVKSEEEESAMRDLDEHPAVPVTETLFFVMPNTSGLVASYKVHP